VWAVPEAVEEHPEGEAGVGEGLEQVVAEIERAGGEAPRQIQQTESGPGEETAAFGAAKKRGL